MASPKADWYRAFAGRTVAVIASGPSLTAGDCEAVRAAGLPTFVTNTTFRLCPWADVLVAHDARWWTLYRKEIDAVFRGHRFQCGNQRLHGQRITREMLEFRSFGNSGTAAISLAVMARAARVILLGCDAQRTSGASHWHGDHPAQLSNARSIGRWPEKFERVAEYARQHAVPVVNCSRATALECFPRAALEEELQEVMA